MRFSTTACKKTTQLPTRRAHNRQDVHTRKTTDNMAANPTSRRETIGVFSAEAPQVNILSPSLSIATAVQLGHNRVDAQYEVRGKKLKPCLKSAPFWFAGDQKSSISQTGVQTRAIKGSRLGQHTGDTAGPWTGLTSASTDRTAVIKNPTCSLLTVYSMSRLERFIKINFAVN